MEKISCEKLYFLVGTVTKYFFINQLLFQLIKKYSSVPEFKSYSFFLKITL